MPLVPDIQGFQDAQERLREALGQEITFLVPQVPVWPPGTQLDPETQKPYDPTIKPVSGDGFEEVVKTCTVIFRPIRVNVEDPIGTEAAGLRKSTSMALLIDPDDYPDVEDATQASVAGTDYKITDFENDTELANRHIAFLEAR